MTSASRFSVSRGNLILVARNGLLIRVYISWTRSCAAAILGLVLVLVFTNNFRDTRLDGGRR